MRNFKTLPAIRFGSWNGARVVTCFPPFGRALLLYSLYPPSFIFSAEDSGGRMDKSDRKREPGAGGNTAQHTSVAILIIADLSRALKNRETISGAAATESLLIPASVEETALVEHFMEADGRK